MVNSIHIKSEQLSLVLKQLPLVLLANVINSILTAAVLGTAVPFAQAAAWSGLLIGLTGIRVTLFRRQIRQPETRGGDADRLISRSILRLAIASGLSGCIWGFGLAILLPEPLIYRLFAVFVLGGMAAGAVVTLAPLLPVAIAFLLPCIFPLAIRLTLEGERVHVGMGALLLLFAAGLSIAAWQLNRWIASTLRLQIEKTMLADELSGVLADLEHQVEQRTADLRAARDEADRANQTKTRFLAAASHDLGQPFQAMRLFLDLLDRRLAGTPHHEMIQALRQAHGNGERMLASLLDLSRLETGSIELRVEDFAVTDLLERLEREFAPLAASRNLRMRVRSSRAVINSDPVLLYQITANLLANALRYTRSGGVLLACRKRGATLRIEVWDTGIGIPADRLDEIFDEFHRVDTEQDIAGAAVGLGLAIVRQTARLLGHPVGVCSVVHHGSVFSITVPMAAHASR